MPALVSDFLTAGRISLDKRAAGRSDSNADRRDLLAKRFGMLIDKFGTPWMANREKPMS
jgi:uncharacterized glyoxalase superfamily protein PhnB